MKSKHIIQVAPLVPLPVLRTQVFSYWHGKELPAGTLVKIPFYFREIEGVVIETRQSGEFPKNFKLKKIRSVVESGAIKPYQIELARKIAERYFAPLGSVLKLMAAKTANSEQRTANNNRKIKILQTKNSIAQKIISNKKQKFLLEAPTQDAEDVNKALILKCLSGGKQILILVPEVFFAESLFQKWKDCFGEEIALIHGKITKKKYGEYWQKIHSGETKIIIATKMGVFLPFENLGTVIVLEEQDPSFKQSEAMPRYSAVWCAETLSDLSGAKIVFESGWPSAEIRVRAGKDLEHIKPETAEIRRPKIEIVSLGGKKKNPDFPISPELFSQLAKTIKEKKQAVVFVNRRGFSTRSICENCKKVLKCPKCNRALVFSEAEGQYRCLHCAYKADLFTACPACGGLQFSHRGIGTQTVERKIKKLFSCAGTVRLDADTLRSVAKTRKILENFAVGKVDILVGTQSVLKGLFSENTALAASISGRDFADGIEFESRSLSLARLSRMESILGGKGTVFLQSFFEKSRTLEYFEKNEKEKYYKNELAIRKRYGFPPFSRLVKVAFRDKSKKNIEKEMKKTFDLLMATSNNKVDVFAPYEPFSGQKRGFFQKNLLLKCDPGKNIRDLPIRSVLGGLRKGWSVDVDPVTLF
ncbi:MAG: primosomal protein N' [Candidatus Moranbacteria bacterium]|nr:primosomal protein N' [Candidatus Moranbacteria bacterium]